jgi:EpsI family protein
MTTMRLLTAVLLVAATGTIAAARREPISPAPALNIPDAVGTWIKLADEPIDRDTTLAIAADQIVNRTYVDADNTQAGLYVAYYRQQRPGVSIHSPLHCLPGTGWDVLSNETVRLNVEGTSAPVRRLVAQKAGSVVMVLYWYSIHGRVIASDLLSRVQLLENRLRLGRNDAALVRIVVPVAGSQLDAERLGFGFVRGLLPYL